MQFNSTLAKEHIGKVVGGDTTSKALNAVVDQMMPSPEECGKIMTLSFVTENLVGNVIGLVFGKDVKLVEFCVPPVTFETRPSFTTVIYTPPLVRSFV